MHKLQFTRSYSYYLNKYRIYVMFLALFLIAALFAPNFFNPFNINAMIKAANLYSMMAIGFSIVMICGHFDLSVQAVMNLGAVITLGLFAKSGVPWGLAIPIGVLCGIAVGVGNGYLVAKAKINSFIVTLGTMTITQGIIYLYCKSGSISVGSDYSFSDLITTEVIPLFPPITIITIIAVVVFAVIMFKTRFGRSVYMVGGNSETAWLAGINRDRVYITSFVISGGLAALAGSLFAIGQGTAVPNMGEKGISPLMITIASVIIGGVAMSGGKGDILRSYFAVLTMMVIFNMLSCFGTGYEAQVFAAGLVLAVIVLYESVSNYMQNKIKGIRLPLLSEVKTRRKARQFT